MMGHANVGLGYTIDISFSLEASGELAPGGEWASDTATPINGYFLGVPEPSAALLLAIALGLAGCVAGRRRVS
jgi:hypothetical protein